MSSFDLISAQVKRDLIFTMLLLCAIFAQSKDISVCSSCECSTITSAIEEANSGDRIIIKGGTYREGNIIIEKEIELIGEGEAIIDGEITVENTVK